jgi:hypothetical protein
MAMQTAVTVKKIIETSITIASIAAGADGTDQTFTISGEGLTSDDFVLLAIPGLTADCMFCNAHISANDTLKVRFENQSAAPIVPGAMTAKIIVF